MNNFIGFDKYKLSGAYHWNSIENNEEYIAQSSVIINEAINTNPKTILDIGCGDAAISGKLALLLPNSKVYGFDAEDSAIYCARSKIQELNITNIELNISLINSAKELYKDKTFEMVFSLDVIEHLPEPKELIDLFKYFQKDNTFFLLGTPLFIDKNFISPYHVIEYSKDEIKTMVGKHNIIQEWVLPGKRKHNTTKQKHFYEESYYMCKLFFKD